MRKLWIAFIGLLFTSAALADVVTIKPGVPETYTVKKGDTLWGISNLFLEDPWLWPDIWHVNPQIDNPHLIYPGDEIGFITINGEKKLTINHRGGTAEAVEVSKSDGVVKLKPKARAEAITSAIPAIPREYIDGFLSDNRIFTEEELNQAPYVLGGHEGRLVLGAGDIIYGRGNFGDKPESVYQIFRENRKPYRDPETKEILGYEGISMGSATLEKMSKEQVATLRVDQSREDIRVGDKLISAINDQLLAAFYPSSPEKELDGYVIQVLRGVKAIGQFDVVVLNMGTREGLKEGNILSIWRRGGVVKDPVTRKKVRLPSEEAGLLMVFRSFEKLSYGLVLEATRPLGVGDQVKKP